MATIVYAVAPGVRIRITKPKITKEKADTPALHKEITEAA